MNVLVKYFNKRNGTIEAICDHFHVERSTAYNKKNKALSRLSVLLFGK